MADNKKSLTERHNEHRADNWSYDANMKNWRAWGSWFSWGSPVGLGLFFIETAVAVWIFFHVTKP